jgi:peptidyl-prolyl cis-trans isomerase D
MQIIQTIRDKGAAVVIAVIALSLIGFLLMDANSGTKGRGGGFFGSLSNSVGKVNGEPVEKALFDEKFNQADANAEQQAQQYGGKPEAGQLRQQVWDNIVGLKIFSAEAKKLGIGFTSKELNSLFFSNEQGNPFLQAGAGFTDPATGRLDAGKVSQKIGEMKKAKGKEGDSYNQMTEQIKDGSIYAKYSALLNASAYYPGWMQEKEKSDNKKFANISYVAVPYNVIGDSTIKVSDGEIESYVQKHKNQFKQEAGRMISYVTFSQLPSSEDSAKTKEIVAGLKESFITETNTKAFIARNTSSIEFDSNYLPKSRISSLAIDTIIKQPAGTVYGPYVDGANYVLAKVLGTKTLPDSSKARHILIPTADPQTGQQIMEDSIAKKKADSIFTAIKGGADFAVMAKQFGTDGTKDKGGDLGFFGFSAPMVEEFNQAIFGKPVGTKEVIRTRFGYHVIEITGEKGSMPAYKIAFMAKEIFSSDVTIGNANNNATKLSGQKSGKDFDAYVAKNGLQKVSWPTIVKENDYQVGQLRDARGLVRWVFEAKKGDVSEPFNINDQFVVVTIDKVQDEGTQDVKAARQMVEGVIRNKKKAEAIIKTLGATPTLESAATAYKQQVLTAGVDSSITFNSQIIPNLGQEPKVIGASFNAANQTKVSAPIEGNTGVFVIKVNSIGEKSADTPEAEAQRKIQQTTNLRNQAAAGWLEGLKNQATIKDNRNKYY